MERDGVVRDRLEDDGAGDGTDFFEGLGFLGGLRGEWCGGGGIGCGRWRRTLLIELLQFLLGGLVARVDLDGAAELGERAGEIAALAQDAAAIHVRDRCLELHALVAGPVAHVTGLLEQRLVEGVQGGVVVLARFGVHAALVPLAGGLSVCQRAGDRCEKSQDAEQRKRPKEECR